MPIIGTNEVRDRVGMGCALQNLDTLLIKGKWQDQLQSDSMRRNSTCYNNTWEAVAGSLDTGAIYSANEKKDESTTSIASRWFSIFVLGEKRIMALVRSNVQSTSANW